VLAWRDFLVLARELAFREGDESALRTAISRAYYASYCTAGEHVLSRSPGLVAADLSHDRVRWRIFDDGMALRAARLQADYWIPMRGHRMPTQVKDALRRASRLLDALDALP
jgi:hypothetical protein